MRNFNFRALSGQWTYGVMLLYDKIAIAKQLLSFYIRKAHFCGVIE